MGKKNNAMLDYLENNRRFADIFNGFFGKGKEIVEPQYLSEGNEKLDGSLVKNLHIDEKSEPIERIRDVKKIYKNGQILQILCIEDQEYIDYTSAVRTLTMDALEYNRQIDEIKDYHIHMNDVKGDEYMSKMRRDEKLNPVITLWWYHGKNTYDGPMCLKDSLKSFDNELDDYVADYKMNILFTDSEFDFNNFHTEFRELYRTLAVRNDKIAMKELVTNDPVFKNIDLDTFDLITRYTDQRKIFKQKRKYKNREGGYDMCKAMKDWAEDERAEGRTEGRTEGRIEGRIERDKEKIAEMLTRGKTVEAIADFCGYPIDLVREVEQSLLVTQ